MGAKNMRFELERTNVKVGAYFSNERSEVKKYETRMGDFYICE